MTSEGRIRNGVRIGMVAAVLVSGTVATGCSSAVSSTVPSTVGRMVATYAEQPQTPPNYIFPFMNATDFSLVNSEQFQYLMYRPLYWFGQGSTPDLNPSLSLAAVPTYSADTETVTIDLKPYAWSDGETLTAQNVMFWMNMLHSEKNNWAAYQPGGIPDDVRSITVTSPTQLIMHLTGPVNTSWFTSDELSQITPMPDAWDVTASGAAPDSGGCAAHSFGTADAACSAVYAFLSKQAGFDPANPKSANSSLATYATNPLWKVVDGPWKLSRFDASGHVSMVANPTYSGPVKPTITTFREVPFSSESEEFNALVDGKVDVGYLPTSDLTKPTTDALSAGPNNPRLAGSYTMDPLYTWSINYLPYNFNSTGDAGNAGKIFSQLYFRQAMQLLVDQPSSISKIIRGYGIPTFGPVPNQPPNTFVSPEVKDNPYPYSPAKAASLLKNHGWTVVPRGTTTCTSPGTGDNHCGSGIPAGAKLSFELPYAPVTDSTSQLMKAEQASWASVGINVTLSQQPFSTVTATAVTCSAGPSCSWELANWAYGWLFSPDYYPTGELNFQTGAGSNVGSYSDPTNDANIVATTTQTPLTRYENYLAEQLPVLYQPNSVTALTETAKGLTGTTPQNPLWSITPENWRFKR
jgi:peptide/nickel transport system substrate-binding protein